MPQVRGSSNQASKTNRLTQSKRPKLLPATRKSNERPAKKSSWINRERVLFISSRGVSALGRYLMKDLASMLPHAKTDTKLDTKRDLPIINELADMRNASKVIFFEGRKKHDLYFWLSCIPSGPSAKFLVENMNTTGELKMTGNSLKYSRPVLTFDPSFDDTQNPHLPLFKEMLIQTFGTPNHHPKMQPYLDKVFVVSYFADRIWFRCYQVVEESAALAEIGPRFSLMPMKIFMGSFGGAVLWENAKYISPNKIRQTLRLNNKRQYMERKFSKDQSVGRKKARTILHSVDETDAVFE